MGFNVFEPLNRLCGLLMKAISILYLFGIVNINKVVFPDKNCTFAMYFTPQISLLRFVIIPKEFVVSVSGAYLINIYSSGGWGKLRGKLLCCVI